MLLSNSVQLWTVPKAYFTNTPLSLIFQFPSPVTATQPCHLFVDHKVGGLNPITYVGFFTPDQLLAGAESAVGQQEGWDWSSIHWTDFSQRVLTIITVLQFQELDTTRI